MTIKQIRDLPGGVFEGGRLHEHLRCGSPPSALSGPILCRLNGSDGQGNPASIALDADIFSKHLCFIGGIGTGKSNAIFHVISQLRQSLGQDDVMILFDTKGDFHEKFYRPGDVVNANVVENIREGNVVEDWDISGLGLGEAIVGLPGGEPFKFQFGRFEG